MLRLSREMLLPLVLVLATAARAADLKCYKLDGTLDTEMKPCDPTAKVSTCCRPDDFCLSNGLCLGGGGNNGFSQQGCTDSKWNFPCQSYCSDSQARFSDGYHYLEKCSGFDAAGENLFCCGGDYGCCNNTDLIVRGIKRFTAMSRAGAPTSTATGGTTVTVTATPTGDANNNNNNGTSKTDNSKIVAVGAGVGASLGVALLVAVGALVWQIRKQKKYMAVNAPAQQQHVYSGHPNFGNITFQALTFRLRPARGASATPHLSTVGRAGKRTTKPEQNAGRRPDRRVMLRQSLYRGPPGPLRHRCAHCQANVPKLLRCLGCSAVRYCNREHQAADWPLHGEVCYHIKRGRKQLKEEQYRIEHADEEGNAFNSQIGYFWDLHHTRGYMQARYFLAADVLLPLGSLASVREALLHLSDMLRLGRSDHMGAQFLVPPAMLQLDRDQACYDFVKWFATCIRDGRYDGANMDRPYLNIRDADVFEDPTFLCSDHTALNHLVSILLLKLKLLVDIRNIRVTRKVCQKYGVSHDIFMLVSHEALRSPISVKLLHKSPADLIATQSILLKHVRQLGAALARSNEHFMSHVFDPEAIVTRDPEEVWPGSFDEMIISMRYLYPPLRETAGVMELLKDARFCAARSSEDEIESIMNSKTFKLGVALSSDRKELFEDVGLKRIWEYVDCAVENACYLGPWSNRPSEQKVKASRKKMDSDGDSLATQTVS
ncbi:hypothetical protein NLG97_g1361 [Lecanicillium saksenae]|uniref:Uncharacterized protein n=1 Tax=Lecanicillium saksenae TaxID=468837 RepID=A0ACC1R7E3_9HYPO|nr:hypothetical protein NLG97_g1361 [Lecanicillium saksenae]